MKKHNSPDIGTLWAVFAFVLLFVAIMTPLLNALSQGNKDRESLRAKTPTAPAEAL